MKHTYWVILFPAGIKVQLTKDKYEVAVKADADVTVKIPQGDYKITGNKRVFSLGVNSFLIADCKIQPK